jgi:ribosomal protein S18 acetylase RimI-like enzyme
MALALLDATWPAAERRDIGGWIARRGDGGGNRVSAAWPKAAPPDGLDAALERLSAVCAAWGQTPQVQIGPADAAADDALAVREWRAHDHSLIQSADAAALAAIRDDRMAVAVRAPVAAVEELWDAGGIGPARRAVMARAPQPREVLMLRDRDRPAGLAFVAADPARGAAMLHAVHVDARFRRAGVAKALTAAAARWAVGAGAETLALAVTETNAPARALYDSLGFRTVCRYHYRSAP